MLGKLLFLLAVLLVVVWFLVVFRVLWSRWQQTKQTTICCELFVEILPRD